MTPSQAKSLSHDFLRQHSVEIGESLPLIEPLEDLHPQDAPLLQSAALCSDM
jgi:hypothetical protein